MSTHTLWTNQSVLASSYTIIANQEVRLLESAQINNVNDVSLRVSLQYGDVQPANVQGSFFLSLITEFKDDSDIWQRLPCYQFAALRRSDIAPERVCIMQPDIDTFNLGTDDAIFPLNKEVARISRSQGSLPEARPIRACLLLVDTDPQGANAFESVSITAELEKY